MREILKKIFLYIEDFFLQFKKKKDILFVVENEIMFSYADVVCDLFRQDKRLRLWFCVVYRKRSLDEKKMKARIRGKVIPYWLGRRVRWDLIIFPNHGPCFRADCSKIYVGHGLNSGKKVKKKDYVYGPHSFDEDGQIIYEKIFKSSEFIKEQIQKYYPRFYPIVKVVGSLLSDKIIASSINRNERLRELNLDVSKKTILFASSWGPHALIQSQGAELIKQIPDLSNAYNVIISAHLNDYTKAHYKGIDLDELFSTIRHKNVYIIEPGKGGHFMLPLADLLVTDATSLGLYFPPFKRPIIFYDNSNIEFDPTALVPELKEVSHVINNVSALPEDILRAFERFDQGKMEKFAGKVFSYRGQARNKYRKEIYESLHLREG